MVIHFAVLLAESLLQKKKKKEGEPWDLDAEILKGPA